ncbi:MAG: peptidylprolyl isomerase, partial [Alphaproteobacteria bacterium]
MSNETDISRPPAGRRPEPVMPGACRTGGCGGFAPRTPPPPSYGEVWVNGVEIAPEAIAREMQHHPAPDADTAWVEAARALAVRELLLQEARRLGIEGTPEPDEAGRTVSEEDALIAALLDQVIEPAPPEEAACRRYYDANAARFRTPDLFEASHILIEPEDAQEAAWAAAERQATAVAGEVGDDPAAFAEAARAFSACPSALQNGSLGQVRRGDLAPRLQEALEALAPGKT